MLGLGDVEINANNNIRDWQLSFQQDVSHRFSFSHPTHIYTQEENNYYHMNRYELREQSRKHILFCQFSTLLQIWL